MKYLIALFILLCGCSSTQKIEFEGEPKPLEVANDDVLSKTEVVDEVFDAEEHTQYSSCEHFGYCYGCGMTISGKFECSLAFRYSCSGQQQVWIKSQKYRYHNVYHLKVDGGDAVKNTPQYEATRILNTVPQTACL